jgi:hypothetical protein
MVSALEVHEIGKQLLEIIRGIEPGSECLRCDGWGVRSYATTSTWRGGAGGSTGTTDVCDGCWGSGNRHKPWLNLRRREEEIRSFEALKRSMGK